MTEASGLEIWTKGSVAPVLASLPVHYQEVQALSYTGREGVGEVPNIPEGL